MDDPRDAEAPLTITDRLELALQRWDDYRQRPLFLVLVLGTAAALVVAAVVASRTPTPAPVEDLIPQVALTPSSVEETTGSEMIVHVAGEVQRPGVYELPPGSRVLDAITAAGGPGTNADLNLLNLAAVAVDGVQIKVPAIGDPPQSSNFALSGEQTLPVDINSASLSQLEALPGIGPATAQSIVRHREEHGPFASAEHLLAVPGIGPAKLEGLLDDVRAS